jgi:hypothetical protein
MIHDLVVVNLRPDGPEVPTAFTDLQWQTCLRRIVFLHRAELTLLPAQPDFESYCGRDVYQFLLEVICGLHSPLLGENAVMGQFRKFRASCKFPNTVWGRFLRTLTTDLLVDARLVRHHHLQGLGSQSYGSLIRRYLKGRSSVAVLGAGSLAREILPWLTDVRVFYRNLHHASELQEKHPHMQLEQFRMADAGTEIARTGHRVPSMPLDQQVALAKKTQFALDPISIVRFVLESRSASSQTRRKMSEITEHHGRREANCSCRSAGARTRRADCKPQTKRSARSPARFLTRDLPFRVGLTSLLFSMLTKNARDRQVQHAASVAQSHLRPLT